MLTVTGKITGLALAALLLSACVPSAPVATSEPTSAPTPVFESEAEALAAAEEAYAAYQQVSDEILAEGGTNPNRIDSVVGSDLAEVEKVGFAEFTQKGLHSVGRTTFGNMTIQSFDPEAPLGADIIRVFLCSDVSGVDVLDGSGASVVSAERPARTAFEAGFEIGSSGRTLVVSNKDVWSGDGVCQ